MKVETQYVYLRGLESAQVEKLLASAEAEVFTSVRRLINKDLVKRPWLILFVPFTHFSIIQKMLGYSVYYTEDPQSRVLNIEVERGTTLLGRVTLVHALTRCAGRENGYE